MTEAGYVVGWAGQGTTPQGQSQAFRWKDGKADLLGYPPQGSSSEARAVNNFGDACGIFTVLNPDGQSFVRWPIVWWANGTMTELGTLPTWTGANAYDINDYGDVVGAAANGGGGGPYWPAFLWRKTTGEMISLKDLVPDNLGLTNITEASGINNAGQIVATARQYIPGAGEAWVALILTPNPPPPGDFNCDKTVNVDDLLGVINSWGISGGGPADFNGDKTVNAADLMIVIEQWSF